ncbi:Putative sphingomyelin phosphodiesterase asm-3 [Yarrowia lipolytica]|nr:Putative sphingomyelin phosphodiesterase asm-3 [Yarrowia lipolytica]
MVNIVQLTTGLLAASGLAKRADNSSHQIQVPDIGNEALLEWGFQEAQKIFNTSASNCTKCQQGINLGKYITLKAPTVTPNLMVKLCNFYKWQDDCDSYQGASITRGNQGKHLAQVFTLMDAFGLDGQALCNGFAPLTCDRVQVPVPDLSSWWPEKPKNPKKIESSYNETFNVLHISDFHLDLRYTPGQEAWCDDYMCCTVESHNVAAIAAGLNRTVLPAQKLGSYHCDLPEALVEDSMKSVGAMSLARDFEFGLFTGDMVSHDLEDWLSFAHSYQSEEECYYLMKKYMGDIPVYPTFGNHDSYPYGQVAQNSSGFAGDFSWNAELSAKMWKDFGWINETTEAQAEHTYGSFAVTTKRGLRVISLDSNLWYSGNYYNFWNITDPDPSGLFHWLVDELLLCEKLGQKAWIMAHIPAQDLGATGWNSEVFRQVIRRFSPHVIAATFFGHTHADQFNLFYEKDNVWTEESALAVGWITQSVTPVDLYNPAWRYYEVDTKTFEIMDSRNYYSPLNETYDYDLAKSKNHTVANNYTVAVYEPQTPRHLTWRWEYSARDSYDLNGTWPKDAPLNATFWHRAAKAILENPEQNQLYWDHYYRKSPYTPNECDQECLLDAFCSFVTSSLDERFACLQSKNMTQL